MKRTLLLLSLSFLSSPVLAQDAIGYPCFLCSDAQMSQTAVQQGSGVRYVYSMGERIVGYNVQGASASPFTPDQFVQDQFWAQYNLWLQTNGTMQATIAINVPESSISATNIGPGILRSKRSVNLQTGSGYVNAYDVTLSSQVRNNINNAIMNDPWMVFTQTMSAAGRVLKLEFLTGAQTQLTTYATFPDGSRSIFRWNWDLKRWEYVPGTSVDSNQNTIPETKLDFVNGEVGHGDFVFRDWQDSDLHDFLYRAEFNQIPVTGAMPTQGRVGLACSVVEGQVACIYVAM